MVTLLNFLILNMFINLCAYFVNAKEPDVYKKCGEIWSNDKLWYSSNLTYTNNICNYTNIEIFDGEHITLLATYLYNYPDGFNTRNKYCKCGYDCSPRFINTCLTLIKCFKKITLNQFWREFKLGNYTTKIDIDDPKRALDDGYTLFFRVKNQTDLKMVYDGCKDKVKSFNTKGTTEEFSTSDIISYEGWLPFEKK